MTRTKKMIFQRTEHGLFLCVDVSKNKYTFSTPNSNGGEIIKAFKSMKEGDKLELKFL